MGKVANYIDGLSEVEKDRIVRAQKWRPGSYLHSDGTRCLVGHAADAKPHPKYLVLSTKANGLKAINAEVEHENMMVELRFDYLVRRFGLQRIVRACKLRAARGNKERIDELMREKEAAIA